MKALDHRLRRLLDAAAAAPRELPDAPPFGFETRVLAHCGPAARPDSALAYVVLRYALALGCVLMLVSVAMSYRTLTTSVSVEVAVANSAIEVNLP